MNSIYLVIGLAALAIGALITYLILKASEKKKASAIITEASKEAETIKKDKILQAKEKFLELKADHEKVIARRESKMQERQSKLKEHETSNKQRFEEVKRRERELKRLEEDLERKLEITDKKEADLEKMHRQQVEQLEVISGLTPEEAKNQLLEALKNEARADAAAFIQESMEEAKLNAANEARKIVIQSIQRVATEQAIENAVSVFNIENDDIKGRIIGREGRNIRALEAATGLRL